ncbi:uncharacterized protein LOC126757969 [Bactrocera neohumeralis]|uniref:uncharacterized protein LOC126757969 n=1 Tax=Bactrocera neohumeralis TaxID=98809 RepID=UPI002165380A|nr:uncharacterized protein LOC126757969 [Bactrocera neohumeralis]
MSEEIFTIYENSPNLAKNKDNSNVYGKMVFPKNTRANGDNSYGNESAFNFSVFDLNSKLIEKRQPIYDNIKHNELSSQKLLFTKLFGTAKNNDIIYENLCRGCGYGIFEGKNYLCDFCICLVKGNKSNKSESLRKINKNHVNTEENIYENICSCCSNLYNTQECQFCIRSEKFMETSKEEKLEVMKKEQKTLYFQNLDKPKFFDGILGSLKKSSKPKQECSSKKHKRVEAMYNVKGHPNVSPSNNVFNKQGILDFKQKKTNYDAFRREQHIYGRLKFSEHFVGKIPLEVTSNHTVSKPREFLKGDLDSVHIKSSIECSSASRKLSKSPKILKHFPTRPFNTPDYKTLHTPLSESVCYWLELLRQQVHNYYSHGTSFDDGDYGLCIPKSLPSRSVLMHTYCDAASSYEMYDFVSPFYLEIGMTNLTTTDKNVEEENATFTNNISHIHISKQIENRFETMVDVFKQNLKAKCILHKQREYQTSVEQSNYSLNTLSEASYVIRSSLQRTKWPSEHSPIAVMNYQPLSTVTAEKGRTSCFSTCNVIKSKCSHCGWLGGGGVSKEKTKIKINQEKCERNYKEKSEMINTYNKAHGQYLKQINGYFFDIKGKCCNNSFKIYEVNNQNPKINHFNFVCLINNVLISYSLNTNVLHLCSNRLQYFNWFQDWLLYNFNPWSFNVKRALKVLANYNSFKISFKLWAVLNESVKRHRGLWKYDKQGENIYGEAPIDSTVSEQVTKFIPMAFQSSSLESDFIVNENESVQLSATQNVVKNKCMKSNDEVVLLRTKTKETLERSKKAQGKYLDLDENVVKLNNYDYNKNEDIDLTTGTKISNNHSLSDEKNNSSHTEENSIIKAKEEDIYQPIWKFQTVGEALYDSDPEYYNLSNRTCNSKYLHKRKQRMSNDSSIPCLVISDNGEDHGDWETDDEFMFSKQFDEYCGAGDLIPLQTSHNTISQSNSTITSASSSDIITAPSHSNFQHPFLRTVCIFFSLKEPKIRAIVYDYTYSQSSYYFAKNQNANLLSYNKTNGKLKPTNTSTFNWLPPSNSTHENIAFVSTITNRTCVNNEPATDSRLNPINAWKLNLLNISNIEDEDDLFVSEKELLRSQAFKENTEYESSPPKLSAPQLIKSVSSGNILDIPSVDDKKTITERVRSKFPRSVFKINVRSPKTEKKQNDIIRSAKTGSLYLETDAQPEFPIFGAPLEKLEMSEVVHHVPRFVVDCVAYIERKNFILQDGLYRASGNKVAIDELKKKLSESFVYNSNLLVADDIHTITSLLKQFFRELSNPLIPQHIYNQLGRNFLETVGIEALKNTLEEMPDPNRATLKFLIRHLKNVAAFSKENRMPASNLAIVWGPCIFTSEQIVFGDIGRMNTLTKLFIENYEYVFSENERLVN